MKFILYDLAFLLLFTLITVIFLYTRRRNLKRQGIMYLYRTKWGIKFIDWFSKKYSGLLKPMQYLVILSGYTLMAFVVWFLAKFTYFYLTSPYAAQALKVPVLLPLIPYLPELFKIDFLPPFYFTYWIIIIAAIAIPHEFAHGIFARLNKIKIHSTGFGFLGPFLAAFVEPDEKEMDKKSKVSQLAVLAAGTFANILVTVLFALVLWGFFALTFSPAGINFNTYSITEVNVSSISLVGGVSLITFSQSANLSNSSFIEMDAGGKVYFTTSPALKRSLDSNYSSIVVYEDSPAFRAKLASPIIEIDSQKITSLESLSSSLSSHKPGDTIKIKALKDGSVEEYSINLSERNGKAFLGIGVMPQRTSSGMMGWIYSIAGNIKDPVVYYTPYLGDFGIFIYDLLWWIVLVSLSVALVNMIPVGIFDGGKFFFLTVLGLTKSKKAAKIAFAVSTWLIIAIVTLLMLKWAFAVF